MQRELRFYYPVPKFPSVSVTGASCDLKCNHCMGHYLQHMPDVSDPEKLKEFCVKLEQRGGVGLLVSGGSTKEGQVPLKPFISTLRWVKDNTDLIVNLHTGMLSKTDAEDIASTGIDIASVDLVGDSETLKQVYGLDASVEEYGETLRNLKEAGVLQVAPHICVGLHYGEVRGEYKALEVAASIEPEVIEFISLIPTPDTPMADVNAPAIDDIVALIKEAKKVSPGSDIALGCMRSRGYKTQLEQQAIKAGVDRIALASRSTERWAEKQGYKVKRIDGCCATPRSLEDRLIRKPPIQ
ncbi:MAG: radical SAM protein [Candidatus Bathyarchaeota archaeon]|nr:radical SAM protein [Candidatus Bathyarchaeota archaeon]